VKLLTSPTSPYARKVAVVARLRGLTDAIEFVTINPWVDPPELVGANPLSKVPTLITRDGQALYDSRVIVEYLDGIGTAGAPVVPPGFEERIRSLRKQALGDGILDAALERRIGSGLPDDASRTERLARLKGLVSRALDRIEGEAEVLNGQATIGKITIGCALGYLDFRFAHEPWRSGRPRLAAWFETWSRQPAMQETLPPA